MPSGYAGAGTAFYAYNMLTICKVFAESDSNHRDNAIILLPVRVDHGGCFVPVVLHYCRITLCSGFFYAMRIESSESEPLQYVAVVHHYLSPCSCEQGPCSDPEEAQEVLSALVHCLYRKGEFAPNTPANIVCAALEIISSSCSVQVQLQVLCVLRFSWLVWVCA